MDSIELIIELIMNLLKSFLLYELIPIVLVNVTQKYYSIKDALKIAIINSLCVCGFITVYCVFKNGNIFYIDGTTIINFALAIFWTIVSFNILIGFPDYDNRSENKKILQEKKNVYCTNCGNKIDRTANYCNNCGNNIRKGEIKDVL